ASMQAEAEDESTQVEPSDVDAVNEDAVDDLDDGSNDGDSAEVVDVDSDNETDEAEDKSVPAEDDAVADKTPEDINNNDPPVEEDEEVQETEEVETEELEENRNTLQAVTPMAELGNIFEFEYFRIDGEDVEEGAEIGFGESYALQYKWDTKDRIVKAGDTARLTLPDVFEEWPENSPSQKITTSTGEVVGDYTISGGELVFVFDEGIEGTEVHNGFVGFNVTFDNEKFLEEWEQEIDFDGSGEKNLTVIAKSEEVETKLEKAGHPDSDKNA